MHPRPELNIVYETKCNYALITSSFLRTVLIFNLLICLCWSAEGWFSVVYLIGFKEHYPSKFDHSIFICNQRRKCGPNIRCTEPINYNINHSKQYLDNNCIYKIAATTKMCKICVSQYFVWQSFGEYVFSHQGISNAIHFNTHTTH